MKRGMIAAIIVCLLMGAAGGYGIGYAMYEPKIRNYEIQTFTLMSEVSRLSHTSSSQETQILTLESEKSSLQSDVASYKGQVTTLESEKSRLQSDVANYKGQVTTLESEKSKLQSDVASYKGQVTILKSQISSLQDRLDTILGITVNQSYHWTYQWKTWQWDLPIPLSLYAEYLERPRLQSPSYWVDMAKDPKDDAYIDQLIQQINSAAIQEGFTEFEKLNFVIAFVQSLPYTVDIETTPYDEYPRYPIETLFDKGGDCEDTSILVATLLNRMGYDVALLLLENARHVAVGVSIPGSYGLYYEYDDKKYFYLETTGEGWKIGQIPPNISDTTAYIYPIES